MDYYRLLGVARNATDEEIRIAYHELARKFHPDKYNPNTAVWDMANRALIELNEAYSVLRDTLKRKNYDATLRDNFQKEHQKKNNPKHQTTEAQPPHHTNNSCKNKNSEEPNFRNNPSKNANDSKYKTQKKVLTYLKKIYVGIAIIVSLIIIVNMNSDLKPISTRYISDSDFMELCEKGSLQQINNAIRNGANVNATDQYGLTPLMRAAWDNTNPEIIKILLKNGANVNASDNNDSFLGMLTTNQTPLMIAASHNSNPDVLRVLIENGAKVNVFNNHGETPLHSAASRSLNPEILQVLIKNGADVNASGDSGYTPLIRATEINSNPEILRVLIENGANVNVANMHGTTPLMNAARRCSDSETIRFLIENGANVNAVDNSGRTPLMSAAMNENLDVLKLLIDKGAQISAVAQNGETPLMSAAKNSNFDFIKLLIDNGARIDAEDKDALLMSAVWINENTDVIRFLLDKGAKVNTVAKKGFDQGKTPLMIAARLNKNPDVIRLLIDKGADVNAVNKNGRTPLMCAAESNSNPEVLRVLLKSGAKINATDENGWTSLMFTTYVGDDSMAEVLQFLIESGADVGIRNKEGKNALDYADQNEYLEGSHAYKLLQEKTLFQTKSNFPQVGRNPQNTAIAQKRYFKQDIYNEDQYGPILKSPIFIQRTSSGTQYYLIAYKTEEDGYTFAFFEGSLSDESKKNLIEKNSIEINVGNMISANKFAYCYSPDGKTFQRLHDGYYSANDELLFDNPVLNTKIIVNVNNVSGMGYDKIIEKAAVSQITILQTELSTQSNNLKNSDKVKVAAERGDPESQFMLAEMYRTGEGTAAYPSEAVY